MRHSTHNFLFTLVCCAIAVLLITLFNELESAETVAEYPQTEVSFTDRKVMGRDVIIQRPPFEGGQRYIVVDSQRCNETQYFINTLHRVDP